MFICSFVRFSFHSLFPWKLMLDLSLPCLDEHVCVPIFHFWEFVFLSKVGCCFDFCSIQDICDVLMEINVGFLLLVVRWTFVCIWFCFLEIFMKTRFGRDEYASLFMNPNPNWSLAQNFVVLHVCMAPVQHAPMKLFHSHGPYGTVLISGFQNYTIATRSINNSN